MPKVVGVSAAGLVVAWVLQASLVAALAGPGPLVSAGSMSFNRSGHSATLLADGSVLVAGGATCMYIADGGGCDIEISSASAEIFRNGGWSGTGAMATGRFAHTATRLASGKVLVAGGYDEPWVGTPAYLSSSEIYDPGSGTWSATGDLQQARGYAMATLLDDGTVLVAAGTNDANVTLRSAELYSPATGTWSATGSMALAHYEGTMTLLPNGKVLVAGGYDGPTPALESELFDPATGTWSPTGGMVFPRANGSATLLSDGTVLAAGGDAIGSTEIYQPSNGSWAATASTTTSHGSLAVLLSDGTVLLPDPYAEVYDPIARSWSAAPGTTASSGESATALNDGRVLVAGGCCDALTRIYLSCAELYSAPGTPADSPLTASGRQLNTSEGAQSTWVVASFTDGDPNGNTSQYTASIDWGDGTSSPGLLSLEATGVNVSGSHGYLEEGTQMITVSIQDSGGASTVATSPVAIADAPLTLSAPTTALHATVNVATTLTLGTLADSDNTGVASDYSVSVAWGDGSTSAAAVTSAGYGRFSIQSTHTYRTKGKFTITLKAGDAGGYAAAPVSVAISVSR